MEVNYAQIWQTWGEVITYIVIVSLVIMIVVSIFRELRYWFYWR